MGERFIIIGRSSCQFCAHAVDFCIASSAKYVFLDYVDNVEVLEEYKQFHNHETVPIILSNDLQTGYTKKIGGYDDLIGYLM